MSCIKKMPRALLLDQFLLCTKLPDQILEQRALLASHPFSTSSCWAESCPRHSQRMEAGGLHPRGANTEHPPGVAKKERLRIEIKVEHRCGPRSWNPKVWKDDLFHVLPHWTRQYIHASKLSRMFLTWSWKDVLLCSKGIKYVDLIPPPHPPTQVSGWKPSRRFSYNYNDL